MKLRLSVLALLFVFPPVMKVSAQTKPAITGVAFMRVYATDAAAAEKFYGATLGFEHHELDGMSVYPVNHLQWVEVITATPPPTPNGRMAAVGFMTRNAAGLEKYLNDHGVTTDQPMRDGEFGVRDPEDNLVIFVQEGSQAGAAKIAAGSKPSPNAPSHRIIHVGFIVRDQAKEDPFWRGLLGFTPYWYGTGHPGRIDYVSQQAPNGVDWLEYMLNVANPPSLHDSGVFDHFSLGVERMQAVLGRIDICTLPWSAFLLL